MKHYELLIIGGGAAGVTAAAAAAGNGASGICIVERTDEIGGVLRQCTHRGFGMGYFGKEMTGIEYADRLVEMLKTAQNNGHHIEVRTGTIVTELTGQRHALLSARGSYEEVSFDRCILATGCRETTIQSLAVAGTRPGGIYTAGEAQRMLNIYGRDAGDDIIILGTGDIGQIMARHYLDSGKNVIAMIERSDRPGGIERNRRDIITKYGINVILNSTVTEIFGRDRINAVKVRDLNTGDECIMNCSTLITAMGLIPERDILSDIMSNGQLPLWIRLCGNCDCVHDIVDSVSLHAEQLAADFIK